MTACLALVALVQAPVPLADLPIEFHKGQIWLEATLGGKPLQALLDTGAGSSVIDPKLALAAGATMGKRIRFGGTGPSSVVGWDIGGLILALGGKAIETLISNALPIASLSPDPEHPLGAALGYDFFREYVVEIDYAAARVRAYEPATYRPPAGFDSLEFLFVNRIPVVPGLVRLPGMETRQVSMELDTGSIHGVDVGYRMTIREGLDKRFKDSPFVEAAGGIGGYERSRKIGKMEGELASQPFSAKGRLILNGSKASGVLDDYDVTLGNEVLSRYTLIFDYSRSRLYVKPR